MTRPKTFCAHIPALIGTMLLGGCTTSANYLTVQSKYSYPNGDYEFVGRAAAEKKYTRVLSTPVMGQEEFLQLEQEALASQPGADFLVDYLITSDVTTLSPLPVTLATFRLEGTAVRFRELGQQQFRGVPSATPRGAR
jgi:hypothetical protein